MTVTHLPMWDITPVEIAVDVEPPRILDASGAVLSAPSESRICLVAGFALSSQLKRMVTAVERVIPARLPNGLRLAPAKARRSLSPALGAVAIAPMLPLLRLQQRLIRAIEPGLATHEGTERAAEMPDGVGHFVRDFITSKTLPSFEPSLPVVEFASTPLKPVGITLYHLGRRGKPQSILGHWAYVQNARGSIHLISGP
ncbi:MAG TPA: hypothetical protein VGI19_03565 [Candidatus Cybelea sp.]|jgi:hypothetical protein